jgi:hypothetical protein
MNKGVVGVVVLFFGFWLFTDPGGLAGVAESASGWTWDMTQQFFSSVIDFLGAF